MRRRVVSHWPAVLWSLFFVIAPVIMRSVHVQLIPSFFAYPVGLVSPAVAAIWRFKR